MKKKDFIRIINEEIGEFDFLNNEQYLKEREIYEILQNPQFQKQFIIDSITKMRDKINFDNFEGRVYNDPDIYDEYHTDMSLDVSAELSYTYDQSNNPIKFGVSFGGTNIGYETGSDESIGDYDTPSFSDTWYESIAWDEIDVKLYTIEGDKLEFTAFDNAPSNIQELFIRAYTESVIEKKTDINTIEEKPPQYTTF